MTIQAKVRTTTEVSSGMMMTSSSTLLHAGLPAQKTSASGKPSTVVGKHGHGAELQRVGRSPSR